MSHIKKNKDKLIARVRRLKGQAEAIERSLDTDTPCSDILNLVASMRGAINGLMAELIEDFIREHVANPDNDPNPSRSEGAADLIEIMKRYLK